MAEPSRRATRLSIAAAMLALIGVGAGGFVLGRSSRPPSPPVVTPPAPSPAPAPVLPAVEKLLGRAELLEAAGSAADAFAAGRPLPESVAGLAGRDFELRLPFGCPAALQSGPGAPEVEYDREAEALRVRAEPVRWAPGEWLPGPEKAAEDALAAEGIEGFWISRPWTSSEACAPPPSPDARQGAAEQTLGIAQFFTPDTSRVGRRDGKPYEAVERVAPEALDIGKGLRLRLRGGLAPAPGAGPILCRSSGALRPVCLLSVTFDEVAIENAATGETLATWDVAGQPRRPAGR